jgi:hypothetical protein
MPTFKSGAFIQQCFASHPLSLNFKALTLPATIVLNCASCEMRHRLTAGVFAGSTADRNDMADNAIQELAGCARTHAERLRVSAVDVMVDSAQIKCAECRRTYQMDAVVFETYRKEI